MIDVVAVTVDRLDDLADLFESNNATKGCWCMAYIARRAEFHAVWRSGGNRVRFEQMAQTADPPLGMLAYRDGVPAGWCAMGPRARYPPAISPRGTVLKGRDPSEDDDVWLVPCFFVRVGFRRAGVTERLLSAAVEFAASSGATAIEGWPIADGYEGAESFEGREHVFAKCGFDCIARPSPRRAVMRRDLTAAGRQGR